MIRAVIDTNVLVSAMIAPSGNEALLLLAARQGFVTPCVSEEICEEYAEVLARPKFAFAPEEIAQVMSMIRGRAEIFQPALVTGVALDADDDMVAACVLEARADYLVTGNKRHFDERRIAPAKLVNAGEMLDIITLAL